MKKRLPQRPHLHILGEESLPFVKRTLPKEWIIEEIQNDYGVDLAVEIVEDHNVTGAHFLIQLKSTDSLVINRKGFISHSCKTSTLQYFLERPELVIYLVYDTKNDVGYWIWVQDFLRNQPSSSWRKQKNFTVKIPKENVLNKDSVRKIKTRVLRNHKKERLVNAIETRNHPGLKYGIEINENITTITVSPKYQGAEKEYPVNIDLKFNFGNSDEGKQAYLAWEDVFKRGFGAKIDSRYIEEFKFSDPLVSEFFGEFYEGELFIEPIKRNRNISTKFLLMNDTDVIIQIPFVDLKEDRYGTEEIFFTNEHQNIPFKVSLCLNILNRNLDINIKLQMKELNSYQAKDLLLTQKALWEGCFLKIVEINTGVTIAECNIPANSVSEPPKYYIEIVEKLSLIQEKTNKVFVIPEKISEQEIRIINKILSIITVGQIVENAKFVRFNINKFMAQKLVSELNKHGKLEFLFEEEASSVKLFNQEVSLGKIRVSLKNSVPTKETLKLLDLVSTMSDEELIEMRLIVHEPGIIIQYLNWLPNNKVLGE